MRHTGIRIGETVNLPYNCIFIDQKNNKFITVPLGKLDNERNVPLDDKTCKLVRAIQRLNSADRQYLLPRHGRTVTTMTDIIRRSLHQVSSALQCDAPVTPHRLRHTYATSFINAGMSLPALMKLLGHRDYHMTLRYAAVTQEGLLKDYRNALKNLEYAASPITSEISHQHDTDPGTLLAATIRALKMLAAEHKIPRPSLWL